MLLCIGTGNTVAQLSEKERADISKNLDIYVSIFNEMVMNYVDSVPIEKTIQNSINTMLHRFDPYTEYIAQEDMTNFTFMTSGEYGGIGSIITMRDSSVVIKEPYENMPAALAGLRPGDRLLEVDGTDLKGQDTAFTSNLLRGQPNTQVKIKYLRPGEKKPCEVGIDRKRIHVDPVVYYGVIKDKVGYIYLSNFTTESSQSVKAAYTDLVNNRNIESLIIDVRDNGGGVVEDCLVMLNYFLPRGTLLLSMKGRTPQSERTYRATQEPIDTAIPLAIMVNGNSASASEILSGAIQDWDRGIVVGSRTYGKGLVQSTAVLPYDGRLKLTTAKYYIPSGRSIQTIDYAQRDEQGRVTSIPDSLTTDYYTAHNRLVKDGSGILPDFVVEDDNVPTIVLYMDLGQYFFDFVVDWRVKHPKIASPEEFILTDDIYNEFKEHISNTDFTYDLGSERVMQTLKRTMEMEGYWNEASTEYAELEELLKPNLKRDLELHKKPISRYLAYEIMLQYYHQKGKHIYAIRDDVQLDKAVEVIEDKELYSGTLQAEE